jgi:hypothetical protein
MWPLGAASFLGDNVFGERLESYPALLHYGYCYVAGLASLDICNRAGFADVRAAHHLTMVTVF